MNSTYEILQVVIENESMLRYEKSNSKRISERIESEREKELEENGINLELPTYCFVTDKEFIDELYGGYIYEKKSYLG